jgi:hypothetical protein
LVSSSDSKWYITVAELQEIATEWHQIKRATMVFKFEGVEGCARRMRECVKDVICSQILNGNIVKEI